MRDIVPAPPAVVRNEAQAVQELFRKNVLPTYSRFDLVLKRGEGSYVWDVNGKRYLYLGGGIAPKMLKTMQSGVFMQAFADKGRLSDLLIHTPVHIILESRAALMGAAAYAEARAAEISGKSVRAASR